MLEKLINTDVYQEDRANTLRKIALVLTSLLPLFLLFSRAIADVAMIAIGLLFATYCFRAKYYSFLKQPINVALLLLWAWFLVSSLSAFTSVSKALSVSFVFVRYILFFFACTNWLFTETKALKFAIKIITITVIIAALDTLLQFATGSSITGKPQMEGRLTSFLRRPDIGIYLAKLIFPLASFWLWQSSSRESKKGVFLSFSLLFAVISIVLLTGERTATALCLASIGGILFIIGVSNKNLRTYVLLGITGIFGLFSALIYKSEFLYSRVINFASDIGNFPDSLYGQLFKASLLTWKEHGFFTGVGLRQFRDVCPTFQASDQVTYCDLHSHNIYLEILSESGLIGLVIFSVFVMLCLYQIWQSSAATYNKNTGGFVGSICLLGGLVLILFPFSVTMSFITNWSGILNWVGISLCIAISRLINSSNK